MFNLLSVVNTTVNTHLEFAIRKRNKVLELNKFQCDTYYIQRNFY